MAFDVMDILIAVRRRDDKDALNSRGECVKLSSLFSSVDSIREFLYDTEAA